MVMAHNKKQARQKAATAIREIIRAAQDLTSAERVLLRDGNRNTERQSSTQSLTILGGQQR